MLINTVGIYAGVARGPDVAKNCLVPETVSAVALSLRCLSRRATSECRSCFLLFFTREARFRRRVEPCWRAQPALRLDAAIQ